MKQSRNKEGKTGKSEQTDLHSDQGQQPLRSAPFYFDAARRKMHGGLSKRVDAVDNVGHRERSAQHEENGDERVETDGHARF